MPEVRAHWRQLNKDLPARPDLLGLPPEMGYNGPGMHLNLLCNVDEVIDRPDVRSYDLHVVDGEKFLDDALRRIRQAARTYTLKPNVMQTLVDQFTAGATARR